MATAKKKVGKRTAATVKRGRGKNAKPVEQEVDLTIADGIAVHCACDSVVDVTQLVPHPRNPNKHPEKQILLLAKLILNQGWRAPITVSRRSGFVIRGHGRLEAAIKLGVAEVPVDYQDYPDEASEWADLIADNRIAELSNVDFGTLKDLVVELDTGAFDMDLTGFDADAREDLLTYVPTGSGKDGDDDGPGDPDKWSDFDKDNDGMAGLEEVDIVIVVPKKHVEAVRAWLADGEQDTGPGMGKGVMKRCGLL